MATTFPTRADELDAEWVGAALRRAGALPEGRVTALEVTPVVEPGQASEVVRLRPSYRDAPDDAPASLVAKFATPFEPARSRLHRNGTFVREVRFYRELAADAGIATPRVYAVEIDSETPDHILLTEDLSPGRNGDIFVGSLSDVEVALDALPAFHARWWQSERLHRCDWLRRHGDPEHREGWSRMLERLLPRMEQSFPDHFTGYMRGAARRVYERWDAFWPGHGEPLTLVHGDYHPKQMFFPSAQGGRFAVFDWQAVSAYPAAMDVHRVMLFGLSRDDFASHWRRLLERYWAALTEHGVEYPFEALERDFQRTMLLSLASLVFALATTDVTILDQAARARGADFPERFFGDFGAAMEQCRAIDALP